VDPRTFAGTSLLLMSLRLLDRYGQDMGNPERNVTILRDPRRVAAGSAGDRAAARKAR
jgi:hypothetical protein